MGFQRFKLMSSLIVLGLLLLIPPSVAGETPPSQECLAYAYSESESHSFLVRDNSSNFGTVLNVVQDCGTIELWVDGERAAVSNKSVFSYSVDPGVHNLSLIGDGFEENYSFVSFYPDRLEWRYDWIRLNNADAQFIDVGKATIQENWASFVSIVITWFLATYVYWQFVQTYVQRNYIEEVKN